MPIYEYDCPKCSKTLEVIQSISDGPLKTCPECQGPVEKRMSKTRFELKGTGWYTTDYKKKASTEAKSG